MKRAFTMIELLVATLLLAMLVTILSMIFSQSSIAWTTGMASVTALGTARERISTYARTSEDVLLSDDGQRMLRVVSVWDEENGGLRQTSGGVGGRVIDRLENDVSLNRAGDTITREQLADPPQQDKTYDIGGGTTQGRDAFAVGVTSYGPNGTPNDWDDITTMPEVIVR